MKITWKRKMKKKTPPADLDSIEIHSPSIPIDLESKNKGGNLTKNKYSRKERKRR